MVLNLEALVINIIISTIFVSPVLWLAGRTLVGKEKAKFSDAVITILIGTIVGALFGAFFVGILASLIQLIIWLALVKHFFDCGWVQALAISIIAIVFFVIIAFVLGFLGIAIFSFII